MFVHIYDMRITNHNNKNYHYTSCGSRRKKNIFKIIMHNII